MPCEEVYRIRAAAVVQNARVTGRMVTGGWVRSRPLLDGSPELEKGMLGGSHA